jgi:hypothetical protein
MLVRSAIFNRMSGKFNGAVAMESRSGPALRSHVVPANPKTQAQQEVRNALRQVAALFFGNTLSLDQRNAWTHYAAGETFAARLGGTYKPTSAQAFVAVNAIRVQLGLAPVLTPPPGGKALVQATLTWEDATLSLAYPAPANGVPDALAAGGGLRLFVARRPIFQNRRYGSWDGSLKVLGNAARPAAADMTLEAGQKEAGYHLFYRLTGSMPNGQPISGMEGVVSAEEGNGGR